MKKKLFGLAFIVIAVTITSICLCGFGIKLVDMTDEEINSQIIDENLLISTYASTQSVVPFDTCTLVSDHSLEGGYPNIPKSSEPNSIIAASVANIFGYAQRMHPSIVVSGSVYISDYNYDSTGFAAIALRNDLHGKMALNSPFPIYYSTITKGFGDYAFNNNFAYTEEFLANYSKYIIPENVDKCAESNIPIVLFASALEVVERLSVGDNSIDIVSNVQSGNTLVSGYKYKRYHLVKNGVESDEMFLTVRSTTGNDLLIRLGGATQIMRITGLHFCVR